MTINALARFTVPLEKRAALEKLCRVPGASPMVLGLLIASTGGVIVADILAVLGYFNLGWTCLLNTFLMYWQFTVAHDSIHRSAAKNQKLNDLFGHIGMATFAPQISLGIFRWAHIQHHRFTNGPKDPDNWMHGPWWSLPARWSLLEIGYLLFIMKNRDPIAMRHLRGTLLNAAITLAIAAALTYLGYGMHVLLLWFIPSRLVFILVGCVFFWLPHVKDDVESAQDLTLATSMRLGHEWLLTPLCQYHNYHLIHHLFPTMPAYQHVKAWQLLEPELRQRNLQIQHGFAIQPVIHLAT
ncbi:fatty acid desaturase [Pseudomonas sp. NFACC08-1]|uniref:fatty acid desaturase n=1 Tax=Pseudomonas sp. NFACC08-1 TaxID=1566238 RepID=UPI00089C9DC4|nr:fatty acid desaturase [Pseudomonas sp. NFACC08-1]SDY54473.1 Fatty acid desaturase [Pseudomonas sp. NFACC08-1]